jgi:hypothetical protein
VPRWLACVVGPIAGVVLGLAATAYAQESPGIVANDPTVDAVVHLLQGGGLPAVLALLGWWGRGLLASGIPIRVELHTSDRAEIRRLRQALDRREDSGTPDDPPPRGDR